MLKFFNIGSSAKDLEDKHTRELLEQECWCPPPFGTHDIRVLVCQEASSNHDFVLFDSHQVSSSSYSPLDSPSPSSVRSFKSSSMNSLFGSIRSDYSLPSNLSGSQTLPSRRTSKLIPSIISKLMFGTTPLAYKGSTTKIHLLNEPAQIMLTKTFNIHPTDVMSCTATAPTRRGSFSSSNSTSTVEISAMSTISGYGPSPRTSRPMTTFIPDSAYTRDDLKNGPVSSSLPNASNIRARAPRPGYDVRRLRRASQTSMENGTFNPMPLPSSFSHLDSLGNAKPAFSQAARSKSFSIALFVEVSNNTRLREFVFSHFALLETRLHQLQALCLELLLPACRWSINSKCSSTGNGHVRAIPDLPRLLLQQDSKLQEAVARLQQAIYQLYSAPRIQAPLWLNINTYPSKRAAYSTSFMTELIHLMKESQASGQLVSEVITAVLSHHTSWVPTITPADQSLLRASPQGAYDPLWAQLSDLYGNIGTIARISRTIVVGSNTSFVRRLLFILSYFIRCNEVFQRLTEFKEDPESLLNPPPPTRTTYDLPEDHESGSPASIIRSISIPKRPGINTYSLRGSSVSRPMRSASIGEPTTPILPHNSNDRPIIPSIPRRPNFEPSKPKAEAKDSISTESTPFHSRPTTPTTIESRPDSDRASATGEENGQYHPSHQQAPTHHLRVDTRSRALSTDSSGAEAQRSVQDSGCQPQDVLTNVAVPVSRVICSFPSFPSATPSANGAPAEDKILPADILFCKSYGRSLMATYCDHYMSDFALMGVPKFDFQHFMETDMRDTMRHFEIQDKIASVVSIVADANTMKCNVFCAKPPPPLPAAVLESSDLRGGLGSMDFRIEPVTRLPHKPTSAFIDETLHQMIDLARSGLAAEQCLNYLEDRLYQIYQRSQMLSSIARDQDMLNAYPTLDSVAPLLGLHRSDMGVVLAVCSTYDEVVASKFENL